MHKRAAVLGAILLALPLYGQRVLFGIGSHDLQPALGWGRLSVARSSRRALAVWSANAVVALRLTPDGDPVDATPFAVNSDRGAAAAGSDGRDFFVVSDPAAYDATMQLTRIDGDSGAATRLETTLPHGSPEALVWNGSEFLLAFDDDTQTCAILLDARGAVASGIVKLGHGAVTVATNNGDWMAAHIAVRVPQPVPDSSTRTTRNSVAPDRQGALALLHPGDFPPIGRAVDAQTRPYGTDLTVGADDDGYVIAYARDGAIVVEHLDGDGTPRSAEQSWIADAKPSAVAQFGSGALVTTAEADGAGAIVFPRSGMPFRTTPPPWLDATGAVLVPTNDGVLLAAIGNDRLVHSATRGPLGWQRDTLLSRQLASQSTPRLVSRGGATLAFWTEGNALRRSLWTAPLAPDGRPLNGGTKIAEARSIGEPSIAFDGTNFFAVWSRADDVYAVNTRGYACWIAPSGALLGEPFVFADRGGALRSTVAATWNGRQYVAAFGAYVYRLDRAGRVLSSEYVNQFNRVALASRAGRTLGVGARQPDGYPRQLVFASFADSHDCCFQSDYDTALSGYGTVAAGPRLAVSVLPDPTGTQWIVRDFESRRELARVPAAAHPPHTAPAAAGFFLGGAGALTHVTDRGIVRAISIAGAAGEIAVAETTGGDALAFYEAAAALAQPARLVVERIDVVTSRRPAVAH
jgi:hypothetical protein